MPNQRLSDGNSNIENTSVMGQLIPRNVTPKSKDSYQHDSTGGHGGIFHSVYFGAINHRQTYRRVAGWIVERVVREPKAVPADSFGTSSYRRLRQTREASTPQA